MAAIAGTPATPARTREPGWDIARGIAIVLMVLHHIIAGLENAGIAGPFWTFWHDALTPPMLPTFMLISGLMSVRLIAGDRDAFLRRVAFFLYLYVVWTLIEFAVRYALSAYTNNDVTPQMLLFIAWKPLFANWFVYALALFLLFARLIAGLPTALRLAIAAALFLAGFWLSPAGDTSLLHDVIQLYIFFEIGRSFGPQLRALAARSTWPAALLLLAAYVAVYAAFKSAGLFLAILPTILIVTLAVGAVIAVSMLGRTGPLARAFAHIGAHSLEIYLLSFLPAGSMHTVARVLHLTGQPVLVALVGTAVTVAFCLLARRILARIGGDVLFELPVARRVART